ncbi:amidohydrolase family protein [Ohtaekwangia koreensis]|uniref:2,3-dihydroxybenzoate decarboxylase n=1 Tax=Ohtaekwangia koreensis TaxID=688867 RepID=A0A1T5KER0_9BACT|nr:amidohydrolase family protein [Ohtaekwangia koreensis]SKC62174.1 2,3-dihydroxybenzoate decarboxylase [Ohtaekwangia koreensis]
MRQTISNMDRRTALRNISSLVAATALPLSVEAKDEASSSDKLPKQQLRKIATEEAFNIPEIAEAISDVVKQGGTNLDLLLLKQIYDAPRTTTPPPSAQVNAADRDRVALSLLPKLLDLNEIRLADMDTNSVDMQVLSLAMPGIQIFERSRAAQLASLSNDRLAEAIRRNPKRFAGLASFAPQDPVVAAKEMQRAINELKLNGFIVNSHTENSYLDEPRFWPILEAAEALGAPLYIHPRAPSDGMAAPFRDYRLEGAVWGYGLETSTHILRLIFSGVLDKFPKLQIIIGHMGEALPFWLWRLDFMGAPGARAGRKNALKPSEYFQRNITITTSGVEDPLALRFCIDKIGIDRIMWAIDYPFQPTAPAVAFIESAQLSETERAKIAHGNAERIFKIKTAN